MTISHRIHPPTTPFVESVLTSYSYVHKTSIYGNDYFWNIRLIYRRYLPNCSHIEVRKQLVTELLLKCNHLQPFSHSLAFLNNQCNVQRRYVFNAEYIHLLNMFRCFRVAKLKSSSAAAWTTEGIRSQHVARANTFSIRWWELIKIKRKLVERFVLHFSWKPFSFFFAKKKVLKVFFYLTFRICFRHPAMPQKWSKKGLEPENGL